MIRRWRRGGFALGAVALAALVLAGAAVAYWTTTGTGAASTAAPTPLDVTLTAGTPGNLLYPGGAAAVTVTASNPNPYPVRLGSLSLDTAQGTAGFGVDVPHAGCDLTALSFITQTNGGAGWTIPAKAGAANGSLALDLSGALAMALGADDDCQGASFVVHLTVSP